MRALLAVPLLMIAACGGTETKENQTKSKATSLAPGQYEVSTEVTAFESLDEGTPAIDTPVGTRTTEMVCVGEGQLPTEMLTGPGFDCRYDNYYMRNGRMNVTMRCTREGLSGATPMTVEGSFEAESFDYVRDMRTVLAGEGDVHVAARATGRRIGDCPVGDADNASTAKET